MVWSWLTEKDIDRLVRDRDVDGLANLIRQKEISRRSTGISCERYGRSLHREAEFPRRRPKKKGLRSEKHKIRVKVWEALKSQGKSIP